MYNGMLLSERARQVKLTQTEESIVEAILGNVKDVAFYNGAQLAAFCGVSPSLITRLIQKLGYASFHDFKTELEDLYKQDVTPYDTFQKHLSSVEQSESVFHRSIVQDIENLIDMESGNDEQTVDAIVREIRAADQIYLLAMFASECPAKMLSHYLDRLELPYRNVFGLGLSKQLEYRQPKEGDLIIALSFQGILQEIYDACCYGKKKGAKVACVTDSRINSLVKISDYTLIAPVTGSVFDYSHVATMAMMNVIANKLADTFDAEYLSERFAEIRNRWKERNLFYRGSVRT